MSSERLAACDVCRSACAASLCVDVYVCVGVWAV